MDENLRETTELPGSGGTAPNEGNEPETKSIRFVPSAYDPAASSSGFLSARRRGSSCSATTIL